MQILTKRYETQSLGNKSFILRSLLIAAHNTTQHNATDSLPPFPTALHCVGGLRNATKTVVKSTTSGECYDMNSGITLLLFRVVLTECKLPIKLNRRVPHDLWDNPGLPALEHCLDARQSRSPIPFPANTWPSFQTFPLLLNFNINFSRVETQKKSGNYSQRWLFKMR